MSNIIREFKNEFRFLSNFWPAEVKLNPVWIGEGKTETYPTVEHAYQAAKFHQEIYRRTIGKFKKPGDTKHFVKTVPQEWRRDFSSIKVAVMGDLLRQKFAPGTELAEKLITTWPAEILEGNRWGDVFWGIDLSTGRGDNRLGRLLMEVRHELHSSNEIFV